MMGWDKYIFVALTTLLLAGCATYETEGIVKSLECERSRGVSSSEITLDNGVTYSDNKMFACKIEEGVKVKILHRDNMSVIELVVEGTKKVD